MNATMVRLRNRLQANGSWLVVAGVIVVTTFGSGMPWYGLGIFFTPLVEQFGWGRGAYSLATSVYMVFSTLSAAPIGRAVDRWGSRRVMSVGAVLSVLVWFLISQVGRLGFATPLWQLYVLYGLLGVVSAAVGGVPANALIARWFTKNRGLAMGLSAVGGGLPGIVLVPISAFIISTYGWRVLAMVFGCLVVLTLPCICWLLREPPASVAPSRRVAPSDASTDTAPSMAVSGALRTSAFWLIGVSCLLGMLTSGAVQVHAIPFLTDRGLTQAEASYIWSFLALAGTIAKVGLGSAADRLSGRVVFAGAMVLQAASVAVALLFPGVPAAWMFALLFGFGMGGQNSTRPLLVAEYFDVRIYGSVMGLVTLMGLPGQAGGGLFAGYLYDLTGSYTVPYTVFIVSALLCVVTLTLLGRCRRHAPEGA